MKDFLKTTQGKVIAIMGVVIILLVAVVIGLKLTHSNDTKGNGRLPEPSEEKKKEEAKSPYNLYKGHWYSDRKDKSEVVLEKDGTYTGTSWLNSGRYEFTDNDSAIEFKDSLDGIKKLTLKTVDGNTVLYDEKYKHTFYSDKEQLDKAKTNKEKQDKANEGLFQQKWKDVLTNGEWKEFEGENAKVSFTDKEFKNSYSYGSSNVNDTHNYEIESIKNIDETLASYIIKVDGSGSYELNVGEKDSKYKLYFSFLPGFKNYTKNISDVSLTQQGTTKSEGEKEKVTVTESTDGKGNRVTKKEKVINEKDGWD